MACYEVVQWDARGTPAATRPAMHVWRLFRREPRYDFTPEDESSAIGFGEGEVVVGFFEVWYCERCRLVEEAKIDAKEPDDGA